MMPPISSFQNPRVKFLRALRLRKHRQRERCFFVEGIRIVEEALACKAPLQTLVYAPDLLVSERARSLVEQVPPTLRLALSADVFRGLSERNQPQGIAAVIDMPEPPLSAISPAADMLLLVAFQLRDPGNLGAIVRTADATGAVGVVVVEPSVDLYDPQTVRATMGSLFALPIVRLAEADELWAWCDDVRRAGLPLCVVGTSAHGSLIHFDVDYDRPLALLIGSEQRGLPPSARARADVLVRLPMVGRASSLNASAAAAALVYEVIRQRRAASDAGG